MKKLNVNKQTKKNVVWNTIGAFTTSITSLFYTIILTRFSNLTETGIYSFAFAMACVTVTLASFGGRTYQVTDVKDEISPFSYIISRYITVFTTLILVLCYLFTKDYSIYKFVIIVLVCVFKYLEELSDVYYGILQKENKLYYVGQFQFSKAIINVLLFFLIIKLSGNLLLAIVSITLVNLIFLIFFDRHKAKILKPWNNILKKEHIKKYFKVNVVICLFIFLTSYIANAPKYAIDKFLSDSDQAVFGIIVMPATVMLLVGTFIINPILVSVANMYSDNKIKEIKQMLKKIILGVSGIGILALIVCYLIGIPFLNIIYGVNFNKYKFELMIIVFGSILYTLTAIMSYMLTAMRQINIQLWINIVVSIIAYIISFILVDKYSIMGGAISYTIIMIIRFLIYLIVFFAEKEKPQNSQKRILHLLASNKFSGAENIACTIIENDKNVCFYCSYDGSISDVLKKRKINFIPIKKLNVIELNKIVKKNNINVIHAHDFKASFCAGLLGKKVKVISHIHCNPDFIKKWNLFSIAYSMISNNFSKIIVVSKEVLSGTVFYRKIKNKVCVLENVVDKNKVCQLSKAFETEKYDIIFIGRLVDLKRPLMFLEIIEKLTLKNKNIKACMIGDGELYNMCEKYIKDHNLQNNITMKGFQANPFPYLKNSKVSIITSQYEGFGLTAIESMILGVPVLNSGVGGLHTIFHKHKKYICNTVQDYIKHYFELIKVTKNKIIEECNLIIKDYIDIEKYVDTLNDIYNR